MDGSIDNTMLGEFVNVVDRVNELSGIQTLHPT